MTTDDFGPKKPDAMMAKPSECGDTASALFLWSGNRRAYAIEDEGGVSNNQRIIRLLSNRSSLKFPSHYPGNPRGSSIRVGPRTFSDSPAKLLMNAASARFKRQVSADQIPDLKRQKAS